MMSDGHDIDIKYNEWLCCFIKSIVFRQICVMVIFGNFELQRKIEIKINKNKIENE
jgi:hypothetical protein